jgi:uncharacterized protein (DUF1499 family)
LSPWIRWPGYLAWAFLGLIAISVLSVRAGRWQEGLLLYAIAGLLSLVVLAIHAVQFLLPRFQEQRGAILRRTLPALPGAILFVTAMQAGQVPPIHDITTDVDDPPLFETAPGLRGDDSNPLGIKPEVIAQQLEAYPDLDTLRLSTSFENAYNRALTTARAMGWEITREDPTAGYIEAVDTTTVMNFRDDIVIRVRTNAEGSLVDLRSVSRVGRSDLGANARRIRAYLSTFEAGGA